MDMNTYQELAAKTAIYKQKLIYPALGIANEAGEVSGKVKKMLRDDEGVLTQKRKEEIIKELGDVLWYAAMIAHDINVSLDVVAQENIAKLADRKTRNVIGGSGDTR